MKTVIIGLDGATFDLINPLSSEGRLPILSRLMRDGSSAPLRSTILPNSFPGWSSCTTGTSEGMHGVFSPFIKNPQSYHVRAMSGRDIMTRPVWEILTGEGGRSIVINVPTTYPPESLDGVMVSGMLAPGIHSDFTYPSSLKNEVLTEIPGYLIEPARDPDRRIRAEDFRDANRKHEQITHYLLKKGDWDFLMVVFSVLDRAQHDFWADMDPSHPRHHPDSASEFCEFIPEIYEQLDAAVGRLLDALPKSARVFIVSDHGFCSELFEIRVNELLASAGLLAFKSPQLRHTKARLRGLKEKVDRRLRPQSMNGNVLDRKVQSGRNFLEEIDWARTRAFFAQDKGVWVNLAGREPNGIVSELNFESVAEECRSALQELVSPDDGKPLFERVMSRADAFEGRWAHRLPDIVLIPRDDRYVYNERPGYGEIVVPADSTTGTHARDGIFIAWGEGVARQAGFRSQPNLRDVAPTVLASLGCPLSEDMDGRALTEIFIETIDVARRGSSYRPLASEAASASIYSAAEETELKERLRALGYME